MNLNLLRKP